jgi:hypothetical protein
MGNCACYRPVPEIVMKEYWEKLPIRQITPSVYKEYIKKEVSKATSIEALLLIVLTPKLLATTDDKVNRVTCSIFTNFLDKFRADYKFVILSLIFLTKPTSSSELFISMRQLIKHLDLDILRTEHNVEFIEKRYLEKILVSYVNLISLFCIDYVKSLQDDSDFVIHLSEEYQFCFIETYVKRIVDSFIHDNVLLSKFLDDYMDNIINDVVVREGLHKLHTEELKKPIYTTPGFR